MIKKVPAFCLILLSLIIVFFGFFKTENAVILEGFDFSKITKKSVLTSGRQMPLNSAAKNALKKISGKSQIKTELGKISAIEWFLLCSSKDEKASGLEIFRVDSSDISSIFTSEKNKRYFSFDDIFPHLSILMQNPSNQAKSLVENILFYSIISSSFEDKKIPFNYDIADKIYFVKDENESVENEAWKGLKQADENSKIFFSIPEIVLNRDFKSFNNLEFDSRNKDKFENFFIEFDFYKRALIIYFIAFLGLIFGLLFKNKYLIKGAICVAIIGFLIQSFALTGRSYIMQKPPVTNLYSSVVFTGWGSMLISLFFLKRSNLIFIIGALLCAIGSLVVAMNLPYSGDDMGKMQAVLDSNIYLALHVLTMMMGYCGAFLSAIIAIFYSILNLFSIKILKNKISLLKDLEKAMFVSLIFCLVFSFMGTMLGGFWADKSWGRFWGWDPKENGALMVCLWAALCVHFYIFYPRKKRLKVAIGIFLNIVTAWAWFGVNMLSVGLHSYGFMPEYFWGLTSFCIVNLFFMALALFGKSK